MHRLPRIFFIFILVAAPLLFGTVEIWSLTLIESLTFIAACLLLISTYLKKEPIYHVPALTPLLCILGYLVIQMVPLPALLVKLISPATHALYQDTIGVIDSPEWMPLSIHPRATLSEFFRLLAYSAFYVLAVQLLSKRAFLKSTIRIVIIFAAMLAIMSMVQHFTTTPGSGRKIYWFRELTQGGNPFGPYVNRNHYAGWMGMVFPLIFGMFLYYTPKSYGGSFRDKWITLITEERINTYILLGLSAFLTSLSIIMTLSRGGIITLCLVSSFFAIAIMLKKPAHGRGVLIITCLAILIMFLGWMGWEPIFQRLNSIQSSDGSISGQRITIWKDTLNIARDFPATGVGFGAFADIYPKYRNFQGDLIVQHVHNDYLEILAEGGLVGVFLIIWFFVVFFARSIQAIRKRKDSLSIYIYISTLAGIVSIISHSLIDFNLHIGANGLYFFFLMGLNVSAANTRISYKKKATNLKSAQNPIPKSTLLLGTATSIILITLNICGLMGEIDYTSIRNIHLESTLPEQSLEKVHDRATRARRFDPLEPKYRYAAANIAAYRSSDHLAMKQYRAALLLNPTQGEYIQRIALKLSQDGQPVKADKLFQANIKYHPTNAVMSYVYAVWLLNQNRKSAAITYFRRAISKAPRIVESSLTQMVMHGLSDLEIRRALPESVQPYLYFADYLQKTGNTAMAETTYRRALQLIKKEKIVRATPFEKVCQFYLEHSRMEEALDVIDMALEYLPGNLQLRLKAATLHEKNGNADRAMAQYQKILDMDPINKRAKIGLNKYAPVK